MTIIFDYFVGDSTNFSGFRTTHRTYQQVIITKFDIRCVVWTRYYIHNKQIMQNTIISRVCFSYYIAVVMRHLFKVDTDERKCVLYPRIEIIRKSRVQTGIRNLHQNKGKYVTAVVCRSKIAFISFAPRWVCIATVIDYQHIFDYFIETRWTRMTVLILSELLTSHCILSTGNNLQSQFDIRFVVNAL